MGLITVKELEEMVGDYKTISAKKAFLTRLLKDVKYHRDEVKEAYEKRKKRISSRMVFGG